MSAMRVLNAGFAMMTGALTRILGAQVLKDAQTFVTAFDTMFGGFRERAEATYRLLQAPGTAFLVVAAPEPDALREASYFVERLSEEDMPLAGLVLNRMRSSLAPGLSVERAEVAAEALAEQGGHELAAAVLEVHAERLRLASRDRRMRDRFTSAHPDVGLVEVPALAEDVHDLDGLRTVGAALGGD